MKDYIATIDNVELTGELSLAVPNKTQRLIETTLLDGSVSVQGVGVPVTRVNVEYYCGYTTREILEGYAETGKAFIVYYGSNVYTGMITAAGITAEEFIYDQLEKLTFTILLTGRSR